MIILNHDLTESIDTNFCNSYGITPIFISSEKRIAVLSVESDGEGFNFIKQNKKLFISFNNKDGAYLVDFIEFKNDVNSINDNYQIIILTWIDEV